MGINHSAQLCQHCNCTAHGMTLSTAIGTPCLRPVHGARPPALPAPRGDLRPSFLPREFSTSPHRLLEGKANKTQHLSWKPPGSSGQRAELPHGLWEALALPFSSQCLSPASADRAQPSQCLHLVRSKEQVACWFAFMSWGALTLSPLDYKHICKNIDFVENNLMIYL